MTDIITAADKLACVRRELAMRKAAYPKFQAAGKISAGRAVHEIACMEAIVRDYEAMTGQEKKHQ